MDVVSQSNIRRLFGQDPDKALENDDFLKLLKQNEGNVEAQRQFLRSSNALRYDFTQHYKSSAPHINGTGKGGAAAPQVNEIAGVEAA